MEAALPVDGGNRATRGAQEVSGNWVVMVGRKSPREALCNQGWSIAWEQPPIIQPNPELPAVT